MKIRAFVVDDNEAVRSLLSHILEDRGYEVRASSEPAHCLVYLDRTCPCPKDHACGDIFIVDIDMPNMTGLEFIENQMLNGCKAIVQNKAVMSGDWSAERARHAKGLGCKILNKAFDMDEFTAWLDACEKRIDWNRKLSGVPPP
jgi:CheY-like chemotaxis protein